LRRLFLQAKVLEGLLHLTFRYGFLLLLLMVVGVVMMMMMQMQIP
jgi:hypothetical protein